MTSHDPRIDAYIAGSAEFARPILEHLRALVHDACPDVEETLKWRMPAFVYGGAILCTMAAFKRHAAFGFWRHAEVIGGDPPAEGIGSFGKLTSVRDLPPKRRLLALVKKATALHAAGAGPMRAAKAKPLPEMPADFAAALRAVPKALATFEAFAPSHRREYLEWIVEAKRPDTRARRIARTLTWLAEGKSRNWKYERC
ncbi:MAG: YdeI/OmpD-associated family protein [Pseudomonadota bacterium]